MKLFRLEAARQNHICCQDNLHVIEIQFAKQPSSGTCSAESWLGVNTDMCRIFMVGANPSFIRALKDRRVDEDTNYEQQISFYKKTF